MFSDKLPTKWNYGDYSSSNYGAHTIAIDIPPSRKGKHGITLYFSYDTIIAFRGYISPELQGLFARKNAWGGTTGKHLNWLERDHNARYEREEFEKLYAKALRNA